MLNAGILLFDGAGRVRNSLTGPPVAFNAGTPTNAAGVLLLVSATPDAFYAGAPFRLSPVEGLAGAIGSAPVTFANGFGVTALGSIAADTAGAITTYVAGVPFTATGALAVATPE